MVIFDEQLPGHPADTDKRNIQTTQTTQNDKSLVPGKQGENGGDQFSQALGCRCSG